MEKISLIAFMLSKITILFFKTSCMHVDIPKKKQTTIIGQHILTKNLFKYLGGNIS